MPAKKRPALSDWENLRFFLELYRSGSLSEAARQLGVDHSTVARRIAMLEASLDVRLFDRSARGYERCKAAEELVVLAERVEDSVLAIERNADLGTGDHVGTVRLTTTNQLASEFVVPELAALRELHPGIAIEISADNRDANLTRREADIAIRLGRPRDSGLVTRKIADLAFGFYASRKHRGAAVSFEDDFFLGYDDSLAQVAEERWLARVGPQRRVVFRSNMTQSILAAARIGLGVAFVPCMFADGDPQLKRLSCSLPWEGREVWVVVHAELRHSPRIRVVLDFIAERAQLRRARFAGTR